MKKLLIGCLVLVIAVPLLLAGVAMFALDDEYSVTRSETLAATPTEVHAVVGDLKTWPTWSVWNKQKDPEVVFTFTEPATGVGAVWTWASPGPLKNGNLTVTKSSVTEGFHYDLVFNDGSRDYVSTGGFDYAADGAGTKVVWNNEGKLSGVVEKLFGLLMDSMMGPEFEKGLAGLKKHVEGGDAEKPADDAGGDGAENSDTPDDGDEE